jgi:WD40 repeat protein
VSEIELNEFPVSGLTHSLVSIVETCLQRIKDGTIRWFELGLFTDAFPFAKKLITNKSLFHDVFCVLFSWIEPRGPKSNLAADCLITIGFRKPTSFGKRLSLMIKTTHAPEVPLFLLQRLVDRYRMHSIRFLPALFESIVLPCLDPMDYRVRKASVEPVTEIFKNLNKFYPMTAFHQNRQKFAIGSTQGQVIIYDVRSGTKWRILDGHTGPISAVGFDASGKYVCSYSATDSTVRVWHLTGGGVPGVTAVVVSSQSSTTSSLLGGLLGSTGGKCVQIKQLGQIDTDMISVGIKHPFCLNQRIHGVKIRWTSETDVLLVRENGQGIQIRL